MGGWQSAHQADAPRRMRFRGVPVHAAVGALLVAGSLGLGVGGAQASAHGLKKTYVLNGHICTKVATARHRTAVGHAGDVVCGLSGNVTLKAAGPGSVTLVAGPGHDRLIGSKSAGAHDVLIGGTTSDTFVTGGGDDLIEDNSASGDTIDCSSSSTSVTIAGSTQDDTENSDCQGSNVTDASQEWHGVVTATDGSTTMTVQWSDVNDAAQQWLTANGDPGTATFDISSATVDVSDGGTLAVGDEVEVAANPSDPNNLAGSTLSATAVDAQSGQGGTGEDGGGGQGPCAGGTVTGAVSEDIILTGGSCTITGATVRGDVVVGAGASVTVSNGTTIDGDLASAGASSVSVDGSTVQGDIKVVGTTGAVSLTNNTVQGDIDAWANLGGVSVTGNTVGGDLNCGSNAPAPTGSGNTVSGAENGQCAGF